MRSPARAAWQPVCFSPSMRFRPRPLLALSLAALLLAAGCSRLPVSLPFTGVIEPAIVPSRAASGSQEVRREFPFEDVTVRLEVPVDRATYAGAAGAAKSAIFLGGKRPPDWVAGYYRAFVEEKHQDAFYASLLDALHQVRREKGLDSDRYVELVTSMAQSMQYRTDPANLAPKFPIETFGDGYGDCDDKTLLAAALLSRDGYDVAVLVFSPEKHVALGVRAPGLDYRHTGYAYVEMTTPSLVGVPSEELDDGARLTSQPLVVRIGSGTRAYAAGERILYIQRRLGEVQSAERKLADEVAKGTADLSAREASLARMRQELQAETDPAAAAAEVARYNAQVTVVRDLAAQLRAKAARYNALLETERYTAEHQTSRPQVYARLEAADV